MTDTLSGAAAVAWRQLEDSGFSLDTERHGLLVSVQRSSAATVWLDIGETVQLLGDVSDSGDVLYLAAIETLFGARARERSRLEAGIPVVNIPHLGEPIEALVCADCARIVPPPGEPNDWTLPRGVRCANCGREQ